MIIYLLVTYFMGMGMTKGDNKFWIIILSPVTVPYFLGMLLAETLGLDEDEPTNERGEG